jgi:hypothetical protein
MGCEPQPLAWDEPSEVVDPGKAPPAGAGASVPLPAGHCAGSLRAASDGVGGAYATWWNVRPDSTADLMVAYSPDGARWNESVRVDTLDAGRTGCRRPPPAIAAEGSHVYVAYGMAAREGPGIFASHSMDHGAIYHAPVAVVYGERFGLTSVAARGNTVAVAYEDPNSAPRRIGLAVSLTMGHPFQIRTLVSPPTGEASAPWVSVGPDSVVTVGWVRTDRQGRITGFKREARIK